MSHDILRAEYRRRVFLFYLGSHDRGVTDALVDSTFGNRYVGPKGTTSRPVQLPLPTDVLSASRHTLLCGIECRLLVSSHDDNMPFR